MVETSIGLASETDLIRDNQNNIAITLEKYLFTYGMTDEIQKAIQEFEDMVEIFFGINKEYYSSQHCSWL
jgi:hypothetical protein